MVMHAHVSTHMCDLKRNNNTTVAIYVMRRRRQVHLTAIFGGEEQKCLIGYKTGN